MRCGPLLLGTVLLLPLAGLPVDAQGPEPELNGFCSVFRAAVVGPATLGLGACGGTSACDFPVPCRLELSIELTGTGTVHGRLDAAGFGLACGPFVVECRASQTSDLEPGQTVTWACRMERATVGANVRLDCGGVVTPVD